VTAKRGEGGAHRVRREGGGQRRVVSNSEKSKSCRDRCMFEILSKSSLGVGKFLSQCRTGEKGC
jgi:hypothetical protein